MSEQSHGPILHDVETYNTPSSLINSFPIFFKSLIATFSNLEFFKVTFQSFIENFEWMDAVLNPLWYFFYAVILIHICIKLKSSFSNNSKKLKLDYILLSIAL